MKNPWLPFLTLTHFFQGSGQRRNGGFNRGSGSSGGSFGGSGGNGGSFGGSSGMHNLLVIKIRHIV